MKLALVVAMLTLAACERQHREVGEASAVAKSDVPGGPVVDDSTVRSCTIAYSCGLSHPGLGSSSRTTTVDLATCTRIQTSDSGPYETSAPQPLADASTRSSTKTSHAMSTADCARARAAVTAVTKADATAAQEPAHVDTEACDLTLQCKGEPAPRLTVQRQSSSGPSRVEKLIRAVLGMS